MACIAPPATDTLHPPQTCLSDLRLFLTETKTGETKGHMFSSSVKLFYSASLPPSYQPCQLLPQHGSCWWYSVKKCIIHNHYYSLGKISNPTFLMSIITKNCIGKK